MSRYDLFSDTPPPEKKNPKPPEVPDSIAGEIGDHVRSQQTPQKSRNLLIRGPGGFSVVIPMRFVHFNISDGELTLTLPPATLRSLQSDLDSQSGESENDPRNQAREQRTMGTIQQSGLVDLRGID